VDWHQDDRVRPLVRQYQLTLDAALRDRADLAGCAVCCCHCGIRFCTHPRNASRRDLRCPFGCREHHRRQRGNARSRKHGQTDKGRANKKKLNTAARIKDGQAALTDIALTDIALSDIALTDIAVSDIAVSDTASSNPTSRAPLEQSSQPRADSPGAEFLETTADAATVASLSVDPSPAMREHLALQLEGFVLDEPTLVNSRILPYVRMIASLLEGRAISREELLAALRKRMRQRSMGRAPRREYVLRYLHQHPP
jgi:hypothetical protein